MSFSGAEYVPDWDEKRLKSGLGKIFFIMRDGKYRTLDEIEKELKIVDENSRTGQASISAQLRNLKKKDFGEHILNKRRVGDERNGLFEYSLIVNIQKPKPKTEPVQNSIFD